LQIEPEEFRRQYAELSDEGLLSINRSDLTELARQYYDAEVAQRRLHSDSPDPTETATPDEELVVAETFLSLTEARLGRGLLRSAGIPVYLDNELTSRWTGGLRLLVPASFLEQAKEILEARISDEDFLAQAEAAESADPLEPDQG
jgi:Putative prokaryotic signal transducing protein